MARQESRPPILAFAQLPSCATKLRLAKLRGIRAHSFFLHLKESKWRWNHRYDNLYLFFLKNLRSKLL